MHSFTFESFNFNNCITLKVSSFEKLNLIDKKLIKIYETNLILNLIITYER